MSEAVVLDFTNCKFVIKCSIVANKIATAVLPVVMKKKKKKLLPRVIKYMDNFLKELSLPTLR